MILIAIYNIGRHLNMYTLRKNRLCATINVIYKCTSAKNGYLYEETKHV